MILEDVRNGNTMVSRTENGIVGSCRIWPLSMPVRVGGGPLGNFLTTAAAQRGNNLQAHGGSEPRFVTFLSWTVNGYSGRVLVRASTAYRKRKRERERFRIPRVTPKTLAGIPEFVGEIPFPAKRLVRSELVRLSPRKTLLSFVRASRYGTMLTYSEEEFSGKVLFLSKPVKWRPLVPALSSFRVIAVRKMRGDENHFRKLWCLGWISRYFNFGRKLNSSADFGSLLQEILKFLRTTFLVCCVLIMMQTYCNIR